MRTSASVNAPSGSSSPGTVSFSMTTWEGRTRESVASSPSLGGAGASEVGGEARDGSSQRRDFLMAFLLVSTKKREGSVEGEGSEVGWMESGGRGGSGVSGDEECPQRRMCAYCRGWIPLEIESE